MSTLKLRVFTMTVLVFLLIFNIQANAQIDTQTVNNVTKLLGQIAPKKDPKDIIGRMNQLLPQLQKIDFPANDSSLDHLKDYTFNAVKNQKFLAAYKKTIAEAELPKAVLSANSWISDLSATTAGPTQYFATPAGNLVYLVACQPHNCPNTMSLLYNPKSEILWGILHINGERSYLLGKPSDDQLALLLLAIKDDSIMFDI